MYSCNLCKEAGEEFMVPADPIGVELMKAHLTEKHGIQNYPQQHLHSEHPGQRGWWM